MKRIEYRIVYSEGQESVVAVFARDINSGFTKALALAKRDTPSHWELARIEFSQVTS